MFPKVRIYTTVCVMVSILAIVLEQTSGVNIEDCVPDKPLIVYKTTTHLEVDCGEVHKGYDVFWHLTYALGGYTFDNMEAYCVNKKMCESKSPDVSVFPKTYKIVVNVANILKTWDLTAITCKQRNKRRKWESSYTCGVRLEAQTHWHSYHQR